MNASKRIGNRFRETLIISIGIANIAEIDEAVRTVRGAGFCERSLHKCMITYPAVPENNNVLTRPIYVRSLRL
jgi:sialic acid synthase SpsE